MHAGFVDDSVHGSVLGLARRDVAQVLGAPRTWLVLAVVAALIGLAGPFGTYRALGLGERLFYWGIVVAGTFSIGSVSTSVTEIWARSRRWSRIAIIGFSGTVAAVPVTGFVIAVETLFWSAPPASAIPVLYLQAAAVVLGISLGFSLFEGTPDESRPDGTPPILQRLDGHQRGALVRLAAQDHYVEVVTENGRTLLLMRLQDAIAETAPTEGVQVHRSHWVAHRAVANTRRANGRTYLATSDGFEVPVSRGFLDTARQAGLLARRGR